MKEVNIVVNRNDVLKYFKELIDDNYFLHDEDEEKCKTSANMLLGAIAFAEAFGIITYFEAEDLRNRYNP